MIKEAIILAGGLGTRLRESVPDLPKCMAPVNNRPFLFYVINYWRSEGIEKFVFSLGYKHEVIEEYLHEYFSTLHYKCSVEQEPLGTGGAILASSYQAEEEDVLVVNGDTLFKVDISSAYKEHQKNKADCTLVLKPMQGFERYGVVDLGSANEIADFKEKKFYESGLINGGVYILNTKRFLGKEFPEKFSFEKDYLEKHFREEKIFGSVQDKYFIDIGIPEDYLRVQQELKQPPFHLSTINNEWTLFLDRDGVINYEKKEDYILNWEEFKFYDGVKEAIRILAKKAGKIIIISNQRGVGKGLLAETDLENIHRKMTEEIESAGGRIDAIYYCTAIDPKDPYRKPNPGMAFNAKRDYPGIDLARTVMIGNKLSDMQFAKNAGTYSVFIASTHPETDFPHQDIDLRFDSLLEFANACLSADGL